MSSRRLIEQGPCHPSTRPASAPSPPQSSGGCHQVGDSTGCRGSVRAGPHTAGGGSPAERRGPRRARCARGRNGSAGHTGEPGAGFDPAVLRLRLRRLGSQEEDPSRILVDEGRRVKHLIHEGGSFQDEVVGGKEGHGGVGLPHPDAVRWEQHAGEAKCPARGAAPLRGRARLPRSDDILSCERHGDVDRTSADQPLGAMRLGPCEADRPFAPSGHVSRSLSRAIPWIRAPRDADSGALHRRLGIPVDDWTARAGAAAPGRHGACTLLHRRDARNRRSPRLSSDASSHRPRRSRSPASPSGPGPKRTLEAGSSSGRGPRHTCG
jgi:hypothetical protein